MKPEFDISKCSNRFLHELAVLTRSSDILEEIVNYALNVVHYDEDERGFIIDSDFYLNAVAKNQNTPLESLLAIIECQKGTSYARWKILERDDLEYELKQKFAKVEKDFSLICVLVMNHSISEEIVDTIAERLINGEILMDDCIISRRVGDSPARALYEEQGMKVIIENCSEDWQQKLLKWYDENTKADRYYNKIKHAYRFDFYNGD